MYFLGSYSYLLKYTNFFRISVSWNITKFRFLKHKEFFRVFVSRNIIKALFWENIRNFLTSEPESLSLGLKSAPVSPICHYWNIFRVSICWNIKKFLFLKYKEFFRGFRFLEYKKSIVSRKYNKSFNIRVRKFHFPKT